MTNNPDILNLTDATFEQAVLRSSLPVLLDFWAEWCRPCKMLEPTLEAIAAEYAGRLIVARINVDENPATSARCGIKGIPTLMLFHQGEKKDSRIGVRSKEDIAEMIDQYVG